MDSNLKTKRIIGLLAILMITLGTSCGSKESVKVNKDLHTADHIEGKKLPTEGIASHRVSAEDKFRDDTINAIFPFYLKLKEALVQEDVLSAKKAALMIQEGSKRLAGGTSIGTSASEIVSSGDIAQQRFHFQTMTGFLIEKIKKSGLENGNVFIVHCPMAFENAGANWITNIKEVKNPYFGAEMLTCGTVKETI